MVESSDPIPADGIYLLDAFEHVYRAMNPNWQELESRLVASEETDEAFIEIDSAQLMANKWLRSRIGDGSIVAFVRDPLAGTSLQLSRDGWDGVGCSQSGITSNFVGPEDLFDPGPNAEIDGVRRPVFFLRNELFKLVDETFGPIDRANKRPAHGAALLSGRNRMTRSVQKAFLDLFPSGSIPIGMSSQERNDQIIQHLTDVEKVGPVPNKRTIERALRRLSN